MNTFICCNVKPFVDSLNDCQVKVFSKKKDAETFEKKHKDFYVEEIKDYETSNFSDKKSEKPYRLVVTEIEYGGCGPEDYVSDYVFYVNMTKDEYINLKKSLPIMLSKNEDTVPESFGDGELSFKIKNLLSGKGVSNDCLFGLGSDDFIFNIE